MLILSFSTFLKAGEKPWFGTGKREIELPRPEAVSDNCPKYLLADQLGVEDKDNNIIVSDIDNPMKDVAQTDFSGLSDINDDLDRESLLKVLKTNLKYWESKPEGFAVKLGPDSYDRNRMLKTTKRLMELFGGSLSSGEILSFLKKEFRLYRAVADDGTNTVTITGYYESDIPVSAVKTGSYIYPLHLKPPDLVRTTPAMGVDFDYGRYDENGKLVKYHSTGEIRGGAIEAKELEIAWSAHPSQIMLAQIQGSSALKYENGDYIRIGFDGANGWKFKSVQKILMDCGEVPAMNFKDFIKYLASQEQAREERLVNLNPRYIFFIKKPKDSLPYGAMGYELTGERSVAIDPQYIPLGLTGFLKSRKPVAGENGGLSGFKEFSRFVATHDTGSAIRGPGRIDLFWGGGEKAELEAGSMKEAGEFYLFALK